MIEGTNPVKVRKKEPYAHMCAEVCKKNPMLTGSLFPPKNAQKRPMLDSIFAKRLIFREGAFLQENHIFIIPYAHRDPTGIY